MEPTGRDRRERRPARQGRVVASGLTAAITFGTVVAIADAEEASEVDESGTVVGAVAGFEGVVAFDELTAAADPGAPELRRRPPQVGAAGVS